MMTTPTAYDTLTDDEKALLTAFIDPALTLNDVARLHRVPLAALEALLTREDATAFLDTIERLSTLRAERIRNTQKDTATAALADILSNDYTVAPASLETKRRAATALLAPPPMATAPVRKRTTQTATANGSERTIPIATATVRERARLTTTASGNERTTPRPHATKTRGTGFQPVELSAQSRSLGRKKTPARMPDASPRIPPRPSGLTTTAHQLNRSRHSWRPPPREAKPDGPAG